MAAALEQVDLGLGSGCRPNEAGSPYCKNAVFLAGSGGIRWNNTLNYITTFRIVLLAPESALRRIKQDG
jgi:hypothetical protein